MAGELGRGSSHSSGPGAGTGASRPLPGGNADDFAKRFNDATNNGGELQLADLAETGQHHVKPRLEQVATAPPRQPTRPGAALGPPETRQATATDGAELGDPSSIGLLDAHAGGPSGAGLELDHRPLRGEHDLSSGDHTARVMTSETGSGTAQEHDPATALVAQPPAGLPATRTTTSMVGGLHPASPSPSPVEERVSLLGTDRITGALIGLAIGLAVGIGPASAWSHSMVERSSAPLLTELQDAVDRPLTVRAGKVREPSVIAAEIQGQYGPARSRFWWTWLGFAAVFTLALGLPSRRPLS